MTKNGRQNLVFEQPDLELKASPKQAHHNPKNFQSNTQIREVERIRMKTEPGAERSTKRVPSSAATLDLPSFLPISF